MKTEAKFLVVRLNGEAVQVTPIDDIYTTVAIKLDIVNMTAEDIRKMFAHLSKEQQIQKLSQMVTRNITTAYDEQEAKDLEIELSQYSIKIETKTLEF